MLNKLDPQLAQRSWSLICCNNLLSRTKWPSSAVHRVVLNKLRKQEKVVVVHISYEMEILYSLYCCFHDICYGVQTILIIIAPWYLEMETFHFIICVWWIYFMSSPMSLLRLRRKRAHWRSMHVPVNISVYAILVFEPSNTMSLRLLTSRKLCYSLRCVQEECPFSYLGWLFSAVP